MSRQTKRRATSARQLRPGSLQLVNTASAVISPTRPPLEAMTPDEARAWLESLRERLQKKMARERVYLSRREGRTPQRTTPMKTTSCWRPSYWACSNSVRSL
jgi:hypothetical protein